MALLILSYILLPSLTVSTMVLKLSSKRIKSAASLETSDPLLPIAMPMSAYLRAGASFTPSPVIPTISPFSLNALTIRILCSGITLENIFVCLTFSLSSSSLILFNSSPVIISLLCEIPTFLAIELAVIPLSPVIITTRIPALLHISISSFIPSLGGSKSPTNPKNLRVHSSKVFLISSSSLIFIFATAITRSPFDDIL